MTGTTNQPALVQTSTRARPPLFRHPWRVAIVVVALLAVGNLGIWLLASADTSRSGKTGLPLAVGSVQPRPGELIRPQDTITAQLQNNLTGVLVIDGQEVPEDQLDRVPELGEVSFRPGPTKDLTHFAPGAHTAVVRYWLQGKARPDHPASFGWSFRVGA